MSEQVDSSSQRRGAVERRRRSAGPLIIAMLVILALGVVGGYVLGATRAAREADADQTATPTTAGASETSTTPTQRPVVVASEGAPLEPLSGPPEGTMAMLETSTVGADATYSVTFSPYGYGPGQSGSSLVVRIDRAEAQTKSADGFEMTGRNVLVTVAGGDVDVAVGGVYSGTLGFRLQGGLLSPILRDIKRTE
ncbi:MAG: hypothetical protein JXP37_09740 [Coriobacteriia bacterium]|nr:hypothetical protein [Coriobacteriia bacterium]